MLRHSTQPEIRVEKGENVDLKLVVCADPRPRVVAWEWGSLQLEAGARMGKKHISFLLDPISAAHNSRPNSNRALRYQLEFMLANG